MLHLPGSVLVVSAYMSQFIFDVRVIECVVVEGRTWSNLLLQCHNLKVAKHIPTYIMAHQARYVCTSILAIKVE